MKYKYDPWSSSRSNIHIGFLRDYLDKTNSKRIKRIQRSFSFQLFTYKWHGTCILFKADVALVEMRGIADVQHPGSMSIPHLSAYIRDQDLLDRSNFRSEHSCDVYVLTVNFCDMN